MNKHKIQLSIEVAKCCESGIGISSKSELESRAFELEEKERLLDRMVKMYDGVYVNSSKITWLSLGVKKC